MVRIIKHTVLSASLKNTGGLPLQEDEVLAHFKGYQELGTVYIGRIENPLVLEAIADMVGDLQKNLQLRKNLLSS